MKVLGTYDSREAYERHIHSKSIPGQTSLSDYVEIEVHIESSCPDCGCRRYKNHGTTARGRPRYKCTNCGRTFVRGSCYGRMLLKITEEQRREAELILENSTIDEAVGLTGCSRYIIRCLLFDMDMQKLNVVKPPILDVQASLDDFAEQDISEEVPSNHDVESDSSDQCEVTMLSYPVLATSWSGFYDVLPPVENTVSVAIEKAHSRAEGYG